MLLSADKLYEFIFQQDLAPAHFVKSTRTWTNDHGIPVLDWSANSPDLNPTENLWAFVKQKMSNTTPNKADDLKAAIKTIWASITPMHNHRRLASKPRRTDAVIHVRGAQPGWVCRNGHIVKKPDISALNISFWLV